MLQAGNIFNHLASIPLV